MSGDASNMGSQPCLWGQYVYVGDRTCLLTNQKSSSRCHIQGRVKAFSALVTRNPSFWKYLFPHNWPLYQLFVLDRCPKHVPGPCSVLTHRLSESLKAFPGACFMSKRTKPKYHYCLIVIELFLFKKS
jgi:hypothetical protein